MSQHSEIETLAGFALSFSDCIWIIAGCDQTRLDAQSRTFATAAWRQGLALGAAKMRKILEIGAERGNQNSAVALFNDTRKAVPELREQIVMNDAAEEQRRLLLGDFSDNTTVPGTGRPTRN